jgi:hypothetical protein
MLLLLAHAKSRFVLEGIQMMESRIQIPERDEHTLARNGLDEVSPSIALARWGPCVSRLGKFCDDERLGAVW